MKKCSTCHHTYPLDAFSKHKSKKDGLANSCKPCARLYQSRSRKKRRTEIHTKLLSILKREGCKDCGEKDPLVLEFDHMGDKVDNISHMIRDNVPWNQIEAETVKCEVRYANCHRRKTALQLGYYSDIDLASL